MTWFRLPLFIWSLYATSLIYVLATPVLAITLVLLARRADLRRRHLRPRARRRPAAVPAPVLVLLAPRRVHHDPARAWASSARSSPASPRKRIFGYDFIALAQRRDRASSASSSGATTCSSRAVGLLPAWCSRCSATSLPIPSAIKVFNWTATLHKGFIRFDTPMLYALGFIGLFTIGGLTGLFLAALGDRRARLHDTYFVVAHFHYIMVGGMVIGVSSAGCITGGRRSPAACIRRLWARLAALADLLRLQPDVLPAVHPRLPRHAAALSRLSAGVPGAQRDVLRRRVDPRRRLPAAAGLPDLVAAARQARRPTRGGRPAWNGKRPRRRRPTTST